MPVIETGLVAAIGAAVGSFLNVVILRTHANRPVTGRSACPHCGRRLRGWEMVPILSWLWLRGACRRCKHRLDMQYPVVEALAAAGFVAVAWQSGWTVATITGWAVIATMILVSAYDVRWASIPDAFTAAFALAAVADVVANGRPWIDALIGAAAGGIFFGAQYLLSKRRWVGSGDIFLVAALGVLLGWRMLGLALFLAYLVGTVAAGWWLLRRRLRVSNTIPFGPWLLIGGYAAWRWGESIIEWYFAHAIFR